MKYMSGREHLDDAPDDGMLRRMIVTAALVLAALVVVAALIYAGAFLVLAPMMQ